MGVIAMVKYHAPQKGIAGQRRIVAGIDRGVLPDIVAVIEGAAQLRGIGEDDGGPCILGECGPTSNGRPPVAPTLNFVGHLHFVRRSKCLRGEKYEVTCMQEIKKICLR